MAAPHVAIATLKHCTPQHALPVMIATTRMAKAVEAVVTISL